VDENVDSTGVFVTYHVIDIIILTGEILSEQYTYYSTVKAEPLALKGIFFRIKSAYKIIQWHDDQADRNSTTYGSFNFSKAQCFWLESNH